MQSSYRLGSGDLLQIEKWSASASSHAAALRVSPWQGCGTGWVG